MKRDGMKIGLLVVLVGVGGLLFYNQYVRTPEREPIQLSKDQDKSFVIQEHDRAEMAKSPKYIIAGS